MNKIRLLNGVIGIEKSSNTKLSTNKKCSATWVSQQSCPKNCLFISKGCYANIYHANFTTSKLNKQLIGSPIQLAKNEAQEIEKLTGNFPLRLHVAGDCAFTECAKILAQAAIKYKEKYNQPVFTYTHARQIERKNWGVISVLKSTHSLDGVKIAFKQGYAAALVVSEFKSNKAYKIGEFKAIPCPYQTGKAPSCVDCKLCFNANRLYATKSIILFELHGKQAVFNKKILTER